MHNNEHHISISNINLMKKVFPRYGYTAIQSTVCKHINSIYSKEAKFISKAPVKPLVKNKKLNNRSKSQLNLTKSIIEDMDEHAPILSPIATYYVPLNQKQANKHISVERAASNKNAKELIEFPKRVIKEKKGVKRDWPESIKFKSHSVMSADNMKMRNSVGCRYFSSNPKKKLKNKVQISIHQFRQSMVERSLIKDKYLKAESESSKSIGLQRKRKPSLTDTGDEFDAEKVRKENKLKQASIEALTKKLLTMKELNHYLRMQLNFIVGMNPT